MKQQMDLSQTTYQVFVPIKTVNVNTREHHMARYRRCKKESAAVLMLVRRQNLPPLPVTVKFVRHGVKLMDTGDNLPACMKAMRDQIAKLYGVDDSEPSIRWEYDQCLVKRGDVGVNVVFAQRAAGSGEG